MMTRAERARLAAMTAMNGHSRREAAAKYRVTLADVKAAERRIGKGYR